MNAYDEGYGAGQAEAAAELAECRSHLNMTTSMRELEQRRYIHDLEGWLAEVRERSESLLQERNALREELVLSQRAHNSAARGRMEAEAELEALKGRRCETCTNYTERTVHHNASCREDVEVGWGSEWNPPADFACNRWAERGTE